MPEDEKVGVSRVRATDWSLVGLSAVKTIELSTEIGDRNHVVSIGYRLTGEGAAPQIIIDLNFTRGLSGGGDWFALVIRRTGKILASFAVMRGPRDGGMLFGTTNFESFQALVGALYVNDQFWCEIWGKADDREEICCEFPVPSDVENFRIIMSQLKKKVDQAQGISPDT